MIRLHKNLMFALACLVILGRSQGSAGFCIYPHTHLLEHWYYEHDAGGSAADPHDDGASRCGQAPQERHECVSISIMVDTVDSHDLFASAVPDMGGPAVDYGLHVSTQLPQPGTNLSPALCSLRTVVLLV